MIGLFPSLQSNDGAGDSLLADLHPPPDTAVLQVGRTNQVAAPGDDPGGRRAQELVGGVERQVGAFAQELAQIVFGGGVDDDRHALGVSDLRETRQRDHPGLHGVMGDDVERRRGFGASAASSSYSAADVACPTAAMSAPARRIAWSTGAP